jgi:hypothetical protein
MLYSCLDHLVKLLIMLNRYLWVTRDVGYDFYFVFFGKIDQRDGLGLTHEHNAEDHSKL